jgi:hypothetical protein
MKDLVDLSTMKVHNLPKVVTKNDFPRLGVEPGSLDPKANTLPTEPSRPMQCQCWSNNKTKLFKAAVEIGLYKL